MKVLFVNLVYGTGSTGKIIADIMNLLKKYGNDVKALYGTGACTDNTGKQNRKVLATPVMESFASITGVTTLLRQKHGNCPPPPIFLHSIPFSFVRRSNYHLPLIPSSDGSHACAAEIVKCGKENIYEP